MMTPSATPPTRPERDLLDQLEALPGVRVGWIRLTETNLTKSISDASGPLREAFAATGFHDYEGQDVGPEHKASPDVSVLGPNGIVESRLSLYRPATKGGAFRRIWIEGFKEILPEAEPGDLIAFAQDGTTCLAVDVTDASRRGAPLDEAFQVFEEESSTSTARPPIPDGDSSDAPDVKGQSPKLRTSPSTSILPRVFGHFLWHKANWPKVRVQFPPGVDAQFVEAVVVEANEFSDTPPGNWEHQTPFAVLVNQSGSRNRPDVVATTPRGAVGYRPSGGGPHRLFCEMHYVKPVESISNTFQEFFEDLFGDNGKPSTTQAQEDLNSLAHSAIWTCLERADRRREFGEQDVDRLEQAFKFIALAHEASPGQFDQPMAQWFKHVDRGLLNMADALKNAPRNADLAEFLKGCTFACFAIPTPGTVGQETSKFQDKNLTTTRLKNAFEDHWGTQTSLEEAVKILSFRQDGTVGDHPLRGINWEGLDDSIRRAGDAPLGLAHHWSDEPQRWKSFQGFTEDQFFSPHGDTKAKTLRIEDIDGNELSTPELGGSLHVVDGTTLDWPSRKLVSKRLRVVMAPLVDPSQLREGSYPGLEFEFKPGLAITFECTVRVEDGKVFAEGTLEIDIEENSAGDGFSYQPVLERLSVKVPDGHPLAACIARFATTNLVVLPPKGRVVLAVEMGSTGKVRGVEVFGYGSFSEVGEPTEHEKSETKDYEKTVKRTVVFWGQPAEPTPLIDGRAVSLAGGRLGLWSEAKEISGPVIASFGGLRVDFTITAKVEKTKPKSPLHAAIMDEDQDRKEEVPHKTIRSDLEGEYSRLVLDDLWQDSLGHVVLPSDEAVPIKSLVSAPGDRFMTVQYLKEHWNAWAGRPVVPDDFANSPEVDEFREAFEGLEIKGELQRAGEDGYSKWVAKTPWRQLAEQPDDLDRYLEAYARLVAAAQEIGGACRLWASYPFCTTVWQAEGVAKLQAVLVSPLHPVRLAWLAHTEAVLHGAKTAKDFCGSIEGWNLPLMGPSDTKPSRMLAIPTESGPEQLFIGWSTLLKCTDDMDPLPVGLRAGNRALPGISATGLNAGAVADALGDFRSLYPHVSTLTVDLAAESESPRINEIDEKLIDVVGGWAEKPSQRLAGGLRVLDSSNRTGPIPVEAVRGSTLSEGQSLLVWSRYDPHERPMCDVRFLEGASVDLGVIRSEDAVPGGVVGLRPLRRFGIPDPRINEAHQYASLEPAIHGNRTAFERALTLVEGVEEGEIPSIHMRLRGQAQAAGLKSSWTVSGESLIPPVALASLLGLNVAEDQSQILWEWHPPFLGASNQKLDANRLERRPYMVMVRVPRRLTESIGNLLERLTGKEPDGTEARDVLQVLGSRGVGLAALTRKDRKKAVGAVGFHLALKLMETVDVDGVDHFVMPLDACHGFLSSLADHKGNHGDSRADLLILRLGDDALTLIPVEVKLYGVLRPDPIPLPGHDHDDLRKAREQLGASLELLKDIQERWAELEESPNSADRSLAANALAVLVESSMRLSPRPCNNVTKAAQRLQRLADGDMGLRIGQPLLAFFARTKDQADLRCKGYLSDDAPSGLGPRGEYIANGAGVLSDLDLANSDGGPGRFVTAWRKCVEWSANEPDTPPPPGGVVDLDEPPDGHSTTSGSEVAQPIGSDQGEVEEVEEVEEVDEVEEVEAIVGEGVRFPVGHLRGAVDDDVEADFWPSNTALNQLNLGIVGDLGTGKTQLLQALIAQLRRQAAEKQPNPISVLILDYKGDFLDDGFIQAVGGRILAPEGIPLSVVGLQDVDSRAERSQKKGALIDVLTKIYGGIGPVQVRNLRHALDQVWDEHGASPTLDQVTERYLQNANGVADSVVSVLDTFVEAGVFSNEPSQLGTFAELMEDAVVVLNLHAVGTDLRLKNALVALFLNHYYEYMGMLPQGQYQGQDPQLRLLNSFLVVDEATNIMDYKFDALELILRQGREFGVGVALSTQYLNDFKVGGGAGAVNYAEPLLTWFIHKVPDVDRTQLVRRGLASATDDDAAKITQLENHFAYYKSYGYAGRFIRGTPFFELARRSFRT